MREYIVKTGFLTNFLGWESKKNQANENSTNWNFLIHHDDISNKPVSTVLY